MSDGSSRCKPIFSVNGTVYLIFVFQGRIHQIEYAMEAVKQGSATVGLKSKSHAVLVALKVPWLFYFPSLMLLCCVREPRSVKVGHQVEGLLH